MYYLKYVGSKLLQSAIKAHCDLCSPQLVLQAGSLNNDLRLGP